MRAIKVVCFLALLGLGMWLCSPASAQEPVPDDPPKTGEEEDSDGEGEEKKETEEDKEESGEKSELSLKDGTFLIGKLDIKQFEIETAYGKLTVPKAEVLKVQIGKAADKELKKRIATLIEQLGDEDYGNREKAQAQLRELGRQALTEIREATKSEHVDVRHYSNKLVKEIEALPGREEYIDDDVIETRKFTIRGTLLVEEFVLVTSYATLTIKKKSIKSVVVQQSTKIVKEFIVTGAENTGSSSMKDTTIDIHRGDKIIVKASGSVYIRQYSSNVTPEGRTGYGEHYPGITVGALMGRIGNGSLFQVGSSYEKTAERDGKLYLGIAVREGYSNRGEFRCKVEVERK